MRILIFAAFFLPFKGGYVNSIWELAVRFIKNGHEVTIISTNTHQSPVWENINGLIIWRLPSWNPRFLNSSYPVPKPTFSTIKILGGLFQEKWDIVSTQTRFFSTSWLGFIFAKVKRIPLVHTERGSCHPCLSSRSLNLISQTIDHTAGTLIGRFSQKTIGVSLTCCDFLEHLGARAPLTIPNGIDIDFFSQIKDSSKNNLQKNNEITVIFVGRLIFAKGVQDLLAAFQKIASRFSALKLVIVGDGPYLKSLKVKSQKLGISDKVFFLGEKNKTEIVEILRGSDIFVNPSYSEGLPTSVLEAAAAGLAVIATDVGGTKEIITDSFSGILVSPRDVLALEAALEKMILSADLRKSYGQKLQSYAREHFNWDKITKQYLELFQTLIQEK